MLGRLCKGAPHVRLGLVLSLVLICACSGSPGSEDGGEVGGGAGGGEATGGGAGGGGGGTGQVSVEILPLASLDLLVSGATFPMRAIVRDANGCVASGQTLTWSTSDTSIATIDEATGLLHAVAPGTVTVIAAVGGQSGSLAVTIEAPTASPRVATSQYQTCVLTAPGLIYCWGQNHREPYLPAGTARFTAMTGGGEEFVGILTDGGTMYWGQGSFYYPIYAARLATSEPFHELWGGPVNNFARSTDGGLFAFGGNDRGQLGVGNTTQWNTPVPMFNPPPFRDIVPSFIFTLALDPAGQLYGWGAGGPHLGQTTAADLNTPTPILPAWRFVDLAATYQTSVGIASDGGTVSWGANIQLGRDDAGADPTPQPVAGDHQFQALYSAWDSVFAIERDGGLWSWGSNYDCALADGTNVPRSHPVRTLVREPVIDVASRAALTASGPLYVWGRNYDNTHFAALGPVPPQADGGWQVYCDPTRQVSDSLSFGQTIDVTVPRDVATVRVPLVLERHGGGLTAYGPSHTSGSVGVEAPAGSLPQGVTVSFDPPLIPPGQAATTAVVNLGSSTVSPFNISFLAVSDEGVDAWGNTLRVEVVPPAPTRLSDGGIDPALICNSPSTQLPYGYWCLTNSGGATAPHNWVDIEAGLQNQWWHQSNVCIHYRAQGRADAYFKNPDGTVSAISSMKTGVLCRMSGAPEVTGNGKWLLYHQGIGDPQIEQLTYDPVTHKVGEAWPWINGACPFDTSP